tara:strand:+ start:7026 stop:7211 length:186 start_codon:yes stop_codon:yes gene_type:complete
MSDLGIFITTIAGAIVLVCGAIQKSKCKEIKLCPPSCIRDPTIKTEPTGLTPRLPPKSTGA